MRKTFEDFWSAYKAIYTATRNELFLKKASGKTIGYLLLLLLLVIGGLAVHALSNKIILQIIGIGIIACTIPFWVSTIIQIPISCTKEKTLQRISGLEELLSDYGIDYHDPEVYKLLIDYITERTRRYNPFAYIIETIQSTANVAVLVVTFFSCSQKDTMTLDECFSWIIRIICAYFVVRLMLTLLQDLIVPKIAKERELSQRFLDDLKDLILFNSDACLSK